MDKIFCVKKRESKHIENVSSISHSPDPSQYKIISWKFLPYTRRFLFGISEY